MGDWGLGIGDWALSPNPKSPIPNPHKINKILSKNFQIYINTKYINFT